MKSQYSREVISHLEGQARAWRVPPCRGGLLGSMGRAPAHTTQAQVSLHPPIFVGSFSPHICRILGYFRTWGGRNAQPHGNAQPRDQLHMHTHLPLVPMQQGRPVMTQSM
jgi:hypothetical protein